MGNRWQGRLGEGKRDWRGPQEDWGDGSKEIFEVEESIWESKVRENTDKESLGSCYRSQEDI